MDFKLIPITKPSLDKNDLKHIKNVLTSKILTDGFYQKKSEDIIKMINSGFKYYEICDKINISTKTYYKFTDMLNIPKINKQRKHKEEIFSNII